MTADPRIEQIRAAVVDFTQHGTNGLRTPGQMLREVLDILDCPAPAPRVFFPGDTVPAWTAVVSEHGIFHHEYEPIRPAVTFVELVKPSPEEWQAAVDRAHAALGGPELTTDAELRALTPDQLEACIHRALELHDVQAIEGYLLLMTLKDPGRAQGLVDTLKVGIRLAKEQQP